MYSNRVAHRYRHFFFRSWHLFSSLALAQLSLSLPLSSEAPQKSTRGNKIWLSMHLNFLMWPTHPSVRSPFLLAYVKCHTYYPKHTVYILYLTLDIRVMFNWQLPKQYCTLSQAQVFNKLRLCVLGRYLMYGHMYQGCHSSKSQNSLTCPRP